MYLPALTGFNSRRDHAPKSMKLEKEFCNDLHDLPPHIKGDVQRGAGKILVAPLTPAVCQPLLLEFAYRLPTLYIWQISSTYPFDGSTVLYTRC